MDLNLFDFDYDLTFSVFFLDADQKVYARYGGRDAEGPDERQSLDGLRYTMNSVLDMHQAKEKQYAPRRLEGSRTIRDVAFGRGFRRNCYHCHEVKEVLNDDLKRKGLWDREQAWRYPLPDNLGLFLEVDRGNVIERVAPDSAAARAGLAKGDILLTLGEVPVHSIADAQYAFDLAPRKGTLAVIWERDGKRQNAELTLAEGWRRSDISWRPSTLGMLPTLRLYGDDLDDAEKKVLGLDPKRVAFRQRSTISPSIKAVGIQAGDIILGLDNRPMEGDVADFLNFVRRQYLVGDRITINIIRDGKRMDFPMTLR